jgi:hypothetical protein
MGLLELLFNSFHATVDVERWVCRERCYGRELWARTKCYPQLRSTNNIEYYIRIRDRHREVLDTWDAVLVLLLKMTVHEFSDPRDHIYGCLGLIELVLGRPLQESLLMPDYSLTARNVFTRAAVWYYQNAKELDIIFSALTYHPGQRRKYDGLPSWVPDFAERSVFLKTALNPVSESSYRYKPIFNAAWTISRDERVCDVDGDALLVRGAWIDVIEDGAEVAGLREMETGLNREVSDHVLWTLDYISEDGPYPKGGQSREEAVIQTWTGAGDKDQQPMHPAAAYTTQGGREWFTYWIVLCMIRSSKTTSRRWKQLQSKLASIGPRDSLPTFADLREHNEAMNPTTLGISKASEQFKKHPYKQRSDIARGRSVYRTKAGYLALTTIQAVPGDEIWLIRGCRTPVGLRKSSEGNGYLILGQAYVNGIMNGEAMTDEVEKSLSSIRIV